MIDASIALAWVLPSQGTAETEKLLDEVERGARPVVPSLWLLEVSSALLALERRKKLRSGERTEMLEALIGLQPQVDEEGPGLAFTTVAKLAVVHGLSVYDAVYLELALRTRLPLATRDKALRASTEKAGGRVR